ncbi:DMT family transporter [Paenibacillus lemnae]|uniref:DMT family transporter n=1 Tax=Paenibacillus lemnae TaxID=1330551 RepID=A0A848M665_PAELE|nr:DMT family transporter [Paenibacillus lemnae]NMO95749.1 DMT family transporter [Paenibacillus lemnae]
MNFIYNKSTLKLIAAIGFVIMWSSGFIGARLGTQEANSMTILMWRFLVAGILLMIWWLLTQNHKISLNTIFQQVVIGLFAQGIYLYSVFVSVENGVSAGTSNLITALQPITAAALIGPILGEKTSKNQWVGLTIGILGITFVVSGDINGSLDTPIWAYVLSFKQFPHLH